MHLSSTALCSATQRKSIMEFHATMLSTSREFVNLLRGLQKSSCKHRDAVTALADRLQEEIDVCSASSDEGLALPAPSDEGLALPASSDKGLALPASSDKRLMLPVSRYERLALPASSDKGLALPVSSDEGLSLSISSDEELAFPASRDEWLAYRHRPKRGWRDQHRAVTRCYRQRRRAVQR